MGEAEVVAVVVGEAVEVTAGPVEVVDGDEAGGPQASDQINRVIFRRQEWCPEPRAEEEPCHDAFALAVTSSFAELRSGRVVDADIEVNAVATVWADLVRRPPLRGRLARLRPREHRR